MTFQRRMALRPQIPWEDTNVIGSYRELVALQLAATLRPGDRLGEIHRRFCARVRCPACGLLVVCAHRDRTADVQLILGSKGETNATHLPRKDGDGY